MVNVAILSQNLKLESVVSFFLLNEPIVIVSTNYLFPNEKKIISSVNPKVEFYKFADFLTDAEMALIDEKSYRDDLDNLNGYIEEIRKNKNALILCKLESKYQINKKFLFSNKNDLGIEDKIWLKAGYKRIRGNYYFYNTDSIKNRLIEMFPGAYSVYRNVHKALFPREQEVYISENDVHVYDCDGFKYILIGKLSRIDYRFAVLFGTNCIEYEKYIRRDFYNKDQAQYIIPWHENVKCLIPDNMDYDVRLIQDGYLPSNYSDYTYHFKDSNVKYYVWDQLGSLLFRNKNLPYALMPFRKKLYLPEPIFPKSVKAVLIATSASGDWTAQKNRSDDDLLVESFIEVARRNPSIKFIYRCHPNWILPETLGINSINRIQQLFEEIDCSNLVLSSNIPSSFEALGATHTFARTSLEEDLKEVDIVFGEHSVSMIDAGFKNKIFCSVNLTKRRSFFQSIKDLGFPTCSNTEEICDFIDKVSSSEFKENYNKAVSNYNRMTDIECI